MGQRSDRVWVAHGPMALANANPSVKTGFLGAYIYAIFMVLITLKTGARLLVYQHPGTHEKIAGSQPFLLDQKTASLGPRTAGAAGEYAVSVPTAIGSTMAMYVIYMMSARLPRVPGHRGRLHTWQSRRTR